MRKNIIIALVLGLLSPFFAAAHSGISASAWPGHVLRSPLAAWDHMLATGAIAFGLTVLLYNRSGKIMRLAAAGMTVFGLILLLA